MRGKEATPCLFGLQGSEERATVQVKRVGDIILYCTESASTVQDLGLKCSAHKEL